MASGSCQAGNETLADRIGNLREDNRDGPRLPPQCRRYWRTRSKEDIRRQAYQFLREAVHARHRRRRSDDRTSFDLASERTSAVKDDDRSLNLSASNEELVVLVVRVVCLGLLGYWSLILIRPFLTIIVLEHHHCCSALPNLRLALG
jgi:hypothetical protein